MSSAAGKTLLVLLLLGPGVQVGNEFTACFHLHQGYIAHMPQHALKSRFSVEFPRMQEAKEITHAIFCIFLSLIHKNARIFLTFSEETTGTTTGTEEILL